MKRKNVLLTIGGLSVLCSGCTGQAEDPKKPNIVFIFADDMGYVGPE